MGLSRSSILWISVMSLVSQSLLLPLAASSNVNPVESQKNYYSPHSPQTPSHGGVSCTPTTPSHPSPAYIPPPSSVTPITPSPPVPVGPFPCTYWASHPGLVWGVLGWWGTVCGVFGVAALPGVTSNPSSFTIQHALSNTRTDGYSALYREAAASILNSMAAPRRFPFTTSQVRASFVSALASDNAAASQARLFSLANQGRLKLP